MPFNPENKHLVYGLSTFFLLAGLFVHPLMPIDETRYVAVAWEMWARGDFLVPYLNGEPYSHKPPLLFWLMHLGWLVFGVNDWTPRLIGPVFSVLNLYLLYLLAKSIWPERRSVARLSQYVLFDFFYWAIYSSLTLFDIMLSFFVLAGVFQLYGIAANGFGLRRFLLLSLTVGLGILTKGPAAVLHLIFIVLLAPVWQQGMNARVDWLRWYAGTLGALAAGTLIALCWALPAAEQGGEAYRQAILWGQTAGRMVHSFAHRLPWWWYFQMLPLMLLPWLIWHPLWQGLKAAKAPDAGMRFCLIWALPVFLSFCLISGKQLHYLLPIFPAIALMIARIADSGARSFGVCQKSHRHFAAIIAALAITSMIALALNDIYAWAPDARRSSPLWFLALFVIVMGLLAKPAGNLIRSAAFLCSTTVASTLLISSAFFQAEYRNFDTSETSRLIADLQNHGYQVFNLRKYHGQYNFEGHLTHKIRTVKKIADWETGFPGTFLIVEYKNHTPEIPGKLIFQHGYRGSHVAIFKHPSLMNGHI
ncbi:MAG: ArnT family glycosyltransferase [Gammaproteobacteria bacterium]